MSFSILVEMILFDRLTCLKPIRPVAEVIQVKDYHVVPEPGSREVVVPRHCSPRGDHVFDDRRPFMSTNRKGEP